MRFKVSSCVYNAEKVVKQTDVNLKSDLENGSDKVIDCSEFVAYPPFINCHDHLISNWYPKAGDGKPYKNVSLWVDKMRFTPTFLERNKVWINDGSFDLTQGNAPLIIKLGIYKNLFSGCIVVQDHINNQKPEYYEDNPILVLQEYTQCHSLDMGNWWGGDDAVTEWKKAGMKKPFIVHLGEGTDDDARSCFPKLIKMGLLQSNTLMVHGIALNKEQLKKCAESGTMICWCPESNFFLIGQTLDIQSCLEFGVNVVIGTDSTMSGGINLQSEIKYAKHKIPDFPMKEIFKMITSNAAKALFLPESYGILQETNTNLMLLDKNHADEFENILHTETENIGLLVHQGIPIFGDAGFFQEFKLDVADYFLFDINGRQKFVIGHPEKVTSSIDEILGYHKDFPFLPF
ncbi:MAG: amidohydrolase family protein [Candidatus Cloacimonadales bacterium]|nr:amidohydrolase family protein [Candidatus Cloacimonadales bacterium]